MSVEARARDETTVFFPAGKESIFGILTHPTGPPAGIGVIFLAGGRHQLASMGRNRLAVRVCRRMAAQGYHTLRFDYHGVGESTGSFREYRFAEPFVEDLEGAVQCLRRFGVDRYLLIGTCFGARTALSAAPDIDGVQGVTLIMAPLTDLHQGEGAASRRANSMGLWSYFRRGLRPQALRKVVARRSFRERLHARRYLRVGTQAAWNRLRGQGRRGAPASSGVSLNFLRPLEQLARREVPVLVLYGGDDPFLRQFQEARSGALAPIFDRAGSLIEVRTVEGTVNPTLKLDHQDQVVDLVSEWLARWRAGSRTAAG